MSHVVETNAIAARFLLRQSLRSPSVPFHRLTALIFPRISGYDPIIPPCENEMMLTSKCESPLTEQNPLTWIRKEFWVSAHLRISTIFMTHELRLGGPAATMPTKLKVPRNVHGLIEIHIGHSDS